jgi:hypothetical protein
VAGRSRDVTVEVMAESSGNVLGVRVKGRMSKQDYDDTWAPRLKEILDSGSDVRILLALDEFEGMEPAAVWEDLKYGLTNMGSVLKGKFAKTALVGGSKVYRQAGAAMGHIIPGEIKSFEASELEAAWAWVRA